MSLGGTYKVDCHFLPESDTAVHTLHPDEGAYG